MFCSFLASRDIYGVLGARFRIATSTEKQIIPDVCDVIWEALSQTEMAAPTLKKWQENGFGKHWNFPNCMGMIDSKYVVIQNPAKEGSLYYNYKGSFSLNLMALVDHEYKFTFVEIGDYGSNSDSSVFKFSPFSQEFMEHR